jgi:YtxC-like family.
MVVYEILTFEYDLPLLKLLNRRMSELDCAYTLEAIPDGVVLKIRGDRSERAAAEALLCVLGRDLRYFALAEFADALPLSLAEKQTVLADALEAAQCREERRILKQKIADYLKTHRTLVLEGFLRFRMQEFLMLWELAVEQAAARVLMNKEYGELIETLRRFVDGRVSRVAALSVCIHADGTITLSDDNDVHIEYVDCAPDGILNLLVNMAPGKLTVYDLSGKEKNRLTEAILRVFGSRVKLYR